MLVTNFNIVTTYVFIIPKAILIFCFHFAVFDSSAKIPSGLLSGNINQYGDFDQCLELETELDPPMYPHLESYHIAGKYCLAALDLEMRQSAGHKGVLEEVDDLIHAHRPVISTVNDVSFVD
jgi:hypothetical protein